MEGSLEGAYVRFYATGDQDNIAMSTIFRTENNDLRPLASGEVFYLVSLSWTHSAAFAGNVHSNTGAVQAGEYIHNFANVASGNIEFARPIPIPDPTLEIDTAGTVWGHGFIRKA